MKDTTRSATVAALAVLAVALAAATLDSTSNPAGGGAGPGSGQGGGGLLPPPRSGPTPGETLQVPFLTELLAVLAVVGALALVAYVAVYRREALRLVLAGVALLGLVVVLSQLLSSAVDLPGPVTVEPGNGTLFGGAGGGRTDTARRSPPSLLLVVVVGLGLVGAVVALLRTATGEDDPRGDSGGGSAEAAAVGRAAGRAADRLEGDGYADNEVYRAWREMTELLDVADPDTSTPGEFATAAAAAGLGREDVDELTRLFEDVRYGGRQASDEHERRAVTVFRRIEGRYAEDDS